MGWAEVDPESATERALVVVLADVSASMRKTVQVTTELTGTKTQIETTRIDLLKDGLGSMLSLDSEVSMHEAKDFDGIAEFALGVFPSHPKDQQVVEWIDFPGARRTSAPFFYGKDVVHMPIDFPAPRGLTPFGEALAETLDLIESRRKAIRDQEGLTVRRPILFLVTDGEPNNTKYKSIIPKLRAAEDARHLLFFTIGTYEADREILLELAPKSSYDLHGRPLSKLIEFLSTTMGQAMTTDPNASADEIYDGLGNRVQEWTRYAQSFGARSLVKE